MIGWKLGLCLAALLASGCGRADTVVIGSKNFTEQVLLGEILAQQIEKESGLKVERRFSLGATLLCHEALSAGQIDLYVEYSGTAHTVVLKKAALRDPALVLKEMEEEYRKLGIACLAPLGFSNTFAILVRREEARRLGLETVSQLASHTGGWKAGFGYEFIEREDGWKGLSQTYGLQFAEPPRVMELGLVYKALADGQIDLTAGDSTNGLIEVLELKMLEDDRHYFPPYDAVPLVRQETLERHPALRPALDALGGRISEAEMRKLNYQVDGLRRPIRQVASEFLAAGLQK